MNHCVRDFEMNDDYSIPASSGLTRPKKSPLAEEDIMELLWENGQVVMQSQNQRSLRKSHIGAAVPAEQSVAREIRPEEESATELFMQEDEMASWLHYPIDDSSFDRDLYTELIYPAACAPLAPPARIPEVRASDVRIPTPPAPVTAAPRPPIPPPRRAEAGSSAWFQNCVRSTQRSTEPGPSSSNKTARESTVVDSSVTPAAAAPESRVSHFACSSAQVSGANIRWDTVSGGAAAAVTSSAGGGSREAGTCELTVTSSPGGSGASVSASAEPAHKQQKQLPPPTEDRKRKGREADDTACQSEDVAFLSTESKRKAPGSTKRSRAAEVHNLSERRRRDRINEKMRALQELIPRCNKSDKASMLDEAIEYLKSLQLQVQMMSMGCGMVPMMFPGVQQYMPPMGMGMGIGMGMGMSRPMMPFPSVLAGSAVSTQATTAHLGPRFPMPAFPLPPVPLPDPSRVQATAQSDAMLNSLGAQNTNQPQMPNFADPYQQYLGLYHTQVPLPPNQPMMQPGSRREVQNHEHLHSG